MSEGRDPAIKLFGRKIPLLEEQTLAEEGGVADLAPATEPLKVGEKDTFKEKANTEVDAMLDVPKDLYHKESLSSSGLGNGIEEDQKTSIEIAKEAKEPTSEQDNKDTETSGEDKVLKKPDKVLQCPRCNSMDTKFCYYNNYNVNQPRHFCKNCQRYWTAGGTMRNVPVGAGRRKNKHSSPSYRHTVVTPDALASVQVGDSDLTHHESSPCGSSTTPKRVPLKCSNGTVLKFGPDAPLCESMTSVLNLGDQKRASELGFTTHLENREEPSCSSSVTFSKHAENVFPEDAEQKATHGYQNRLFAPLHHLQCYPVPPWAYAWNPGWTNVTSAAMAAAGHSPEPLPGQENGIISPMSWSRPPMVTSPAFCAPTFSFPIVPASFWSCIPNWSGGPWNLPIVGNNIALSPSSSSSSTSNINCSTLGKHYRDATSIGEEKTEKSLWIPKTLRIDDIDEAAKSSIFATLGIKSDDGGLFKAFSSKTRKGEDTDATQLLHANPAAFSRSQYFQETTT